MLRRASRRAGGDLYKHLLLVRRVLEHEPHVAGPAGLAADAGGLFWANLKVWKGLEGDFMAEWPDSAAGSQKSWL